jgi:tRNA wybutosine-synthesizing protein 2
MKFKQLLIKKTSLPEEVHNMFPASYQAIGDICLVKLREFVAKKYKHMIGGIILDNFPQFKSVCLQKGISGEYRQPDVEVIAGSKDTETIHTELGCRFKINVAKIMWSKGNHFERKRLANLIKPGEIVLDMFAGIGYWSLILAKHTKAERIISVEKNPESFDYLIENICLNKLLNVTAVEADCRRFRPFVKPDRIIMGYFPNTIDFLPFALKLAKKGTIIHFHELTNNPNKLKKAVLKFRKLKVQNIREVKEYSPTKKHYVLDLKVI